MITYRARWVLPIASPPIRNGWVAVDNGRIEAVGKDRRSVPRPSSAADVDLGRVALLPGLVNAHTHLELCWLAGAVPAATRFTDWLRAMMSRRREQSDPASPVILDPLRQGIQSMHASGVALVGDVSNTLVSVSLLAEAEQAAAVFYELIRFRNAEADSVMTAAAEKLATLPGDGRVRVSLAAHAPYSVSPRLFQRVAEDTRRRPEARTTVHLGESPEEVELLATGQGPWRGFLESLGAWDESWTAPECDPVEYLDRMGVLGPSLLAVHGVQLSQSALDRLVARGVSLVTCPRSNRYVGVGDPPVSRFYESGAAVAIGTDSLASAPDLSIWPELARLHELAPDVPASRLLDSATRIGAYALGFGAELGTIEPGKRAALIAVALPSDTDDVETVLVEGVESSQVSWVEEGRA